MIASQKNGKRVKQNNKGLGNLATQKLPVNVAVFILG